VITSAGIGFRVKTGYATAIVLIGNPPSPEFVARREVLLADLDDDDSRQPYHAALERGQAVGAAVVKRARRDAQQRAATALRHLISAQVPRGASLRTIGLVVGSDVDPLTLGNLHIRAHALEGRFYRQVLEAAAADTGLRSITLFEREAFESGGRLLKHTPGRLKEVLARTGKAVGPPWRRDQQLAMLAAWVALAS
jgi:hypothetical protein